MASQENLNKFNKIYDKTYYDVLKYIIVKCHDVNDANDIIQETYYEFWKILNNKELDESHIKTFIISIANNKIKKHYSLINKLKTISLFSKLNDDIELIDMVADSVAIEELFVKESEWDSIWKYLKEKKNQDIPKVFYLYYKCEMTIKDIAKELNVKESYIKNLIFRTLKELKQNFEKENK